VPRDAAPPPTLAEFPARAHDKLRYADTDRQGHVNNAVFASFLETGRVELLYDPVAPLMEPGAAFVIARLALELRAELRWPGMVQIGTRVARIGTSSVTLEQALYQGDVCAATAETVIVHVEEATHRSRPLGARALARLEALRANSAG
jgi:acyl-CoA thioester hydrolase